MHKSVPTKLEAHDCPRCLGMLKLKNVLSLKVRGLTQPIPLSIFRAHTMQSGNIFWHPPKANSPIRLPNSLHRTGFHCSRVQSFWHLVLYLIMQCLHAAARPWKLISWSSHRKVFLLILRPVEVWNYSAMKSAMLVSFTHHATQHSVTPLCDFTTWSSASCLSCYCS